MNENIDLTQILKDCPKGFELYSPLYGKVIFSEIAENGLKFPIDCTDYKGSFISFTKEGYHYNTYSDAECVLFPSKNQRDWSKFTAPWYKKEKFDPNTLKPFDKVLARDSSTSLWRISLFSHMIKSMVFSCVCMHTNFMYCIPYNDDTKHLLGTTDEAPEYYRYWED